MNLDTETQLLQHQSLISQHCTPTTAHLSPTAALLTHTNTTQDVQQKCDNDFMIIA